MPMSRYTRYSAMLAALCLVVLISTFHVATFAQPSHAALPIRKVIENPEIQLDGRLNEAIWQELNGVDAMRVVDPDTLAPAALATLSRFFYSDRGLYVGIELQQDAQTLIPRLSSRDAEINRDGVIVYLDTSGEGLYGYFFGVNLGGTLVDGTLLPERQISRLWDGPWRGEAARTPNGYSVEMFLPWSMMTMPEDEDGRRAMAIAVTRRTAFLDEDWGWPALPASQGQFISGFQAIELQDLRSDSNRQFTFYPFAAINSDQIRNDVNSRLGADIYWRPNSNLQISTTLNPDFGNVESDDVIVNLTAFETFYPEKRPFFLENNDIFVTSPRSVVRGAAASTGARSVPNTFSLEPSTLLNTRRIGGAARTPVIPEGLDVPSHELSKPTELYGAAKITGQQQAVRYGVMLASEENAEFYGRDELGREVSFEQQGRDFAVLRMLHEDSGNGRRAIGFMSTLTAHPDGDAYTNGVDLHFVNPSRSLIADVQLLNSSVDENDGYGGYFDINYIPRQGLLHRFSLDYFDEELVINDLGFLRRNDSVLMRYTMNLQSSASEKLRNRADNITISHERNNDGQLVSASAYYRNTLTFLNSNQLNTTIIYRPARWEDRTSEGHGDYRVASGGLLEVAYGTDSSKPFSASFGMNTLSEDLGDWSWLAKGGVTFKPNDRFSMDVNFMYRRTSNWLIHLNGPVLGAYDAIHWQPGIEMDLFFSARQQLQFSLQWVGIKGDVQDLYQVPAGGGNLNRVTNGIEGDSPYDLRISRLTTQLRYRWEIAPLSDLFVVYTRGGNVLEPIHGDGFDGLFRQALNDPIVDRLVIKLRYRFGNS